MTSVQETLERLAWATRELAEGIGGLGPADVRGPSLLPGWTRGHVLTHLARNAEGGTRLLGWARTGSPSYEYESVTARAAAIDAGAGRPAGVLVADVRATAAAFAEVAAAVPASNWDRLVTYTTGQQVPADVIISSRLNEVLIHHVDLDNGFGPDGWPARWVHDVLTVVAGSLTTRDVAPLSARLCAADTGRSYQLGPGQPGPGQPGPGGPGGPGEPGGDGGDGRDGAETISGTAADLLAWLLGRSDGARLTRATPGRREAPGPLPPVPSVYMT